MKHILSLKFNSISIHFILYLEGWRFKFDSIWWPGSFWKWKSGRPWRLGFFFLPLTYPKQRDAGHTTPGFQGHFRHLNTSPPLCRLNKSVQAFSSLLFSESTKIRLVFCLTSIKMGKTDWILCMIAVFPVTTFTIFPLVVFLTSPSSNKLDWFRNSLSISVIYH